MCEACNQRYIEMLTPTEQADDAMKVRDDDVKNFFLEGLSPSDAAMLAYDRLNENPEDEVARMLVIVLATVIYSTHPISLYQQVRDSREEALSAFVKSVQ